MLDPLRAKSLTTYSPADTGCLKNCFASASFWAGKIPNCGSATIVGREG
jgi:hypothetical protein